MSSTNINDADSIHPLHNDPPSKVKLIIHNQFPGTELVSPVYAGEGTICYLSLD
jgi:hypothetical protein